MNFVDSQALGATVVEARLEITVQLRWFAAGCWFPSNVQCLADLQPATFEPWPVTAHWSNKIAPQSQHSMPDTSRAGRFPWVQQQQSWPLLLHKPPVVSACEIASLARVQVHGGAGAVLANQAPLTFTVQSLFYRSR